MANDKLELIIDLDDGLPPVKVETHEKARPTGPGTILYRAPEKIQITRVPKAIVISVAHVHCLGCGAEHKDHRGIFLDEQLSNNVRVLSRKSLREIGAYSELPRRIDFAPDEAVPICSDCWLVEKSFRDAVAAAEMLPKLDPDHPSPVQQIGEQLMALHTNTEEKACNADGSRDAPPSGVLDQRGNVVPDIPPPSGIEAL